MKLPIRTWQEKALVAAMLASSVPDHHGSLQAAFFLSANEALLSPDATDRALLTYRWERRQLGELERLLFALRRIEPAPGAVLDLPPAFEVRTALDELISDVARLAGGGELLPHVEQPPQSTMVDALALAVRLRDGLR
jgi:hypothetical protein